MYQWSGWFKRQYRQGYWAACSPETVRDLSGIGHIFARRLHKEQGQQIPADRVVSTDLRPGR